MRNELVSKDGEMNDRPANTAGSLVTYGGNAGAEVLGEQERAQASYHDIPSIERTKNACITYSPLGIFSPFECHCNAAGFVLTCTALMFLQMAHDTHNI